VNELAAVVREGRAAVQRGLPTVLATLVATRGSSYRRPGARMLVTSEGWRAGSISGGCLEADITRQAAFLVSHGQALVRSYDTSEDAGARLGCGGEVDVLLEPLVDCTLLDLLARVTEQRQTLSLRTVVRGRVGEREVRVGDTLIASTLTGPVEVADSFCETLTPAPRLLVVGAGHDARPVARLAAELGWWVDVYDWRQALATAERFPEAHVHLVSGERLGEALTREPGCLAVVMAHHLDYDAAALDVLLRDERVAYVGLLGPRHRSGQVLALLESRGRLSPAQRTKLRAPVGLDLGAEGPEAIALSVISEVHAVWRGRSAQPLSQAEAVERSHG
jgi:xanthine/CO dehydrogenase XdhC/CoxF family maturation factor